LAEAAKYPRDTIVSVKRFMGRGPEDAETTRRFTPYRFVSQTGPVVKFAVAGPREVTPMEVSAEILRTLKARAEEALGGELDRALAEILARKRGLTDEQLVHPGARRALLDEARAIKHHLTLATEAPELTRAELDEAIAPILTRTAGPCRRALKDAGITP